MVGVMVIIKEAATGFLATKRIAVTGVSRNPQGHGATSYTSACGKGAMRSSPSTRMPRQSKGIAPIPI